MMEKLLVRMGARISNDRRDKISKRVSRTRMLALFLLGALALLACTSKLLVAAQEELLTIESRNQKEASASDNELENTINYLKKLENLDKYWSENARPRFGRSEYKQQQHGLLRFLPQQAAGNSDSLRRAQEQSQERQQQQQPTLRQSMGDQNFARSILDFVNARMAQRYNSNAAY